MKLKGFIFYLLFVFSCWVPSILHAQANNTQSDTIRPAIFKGLHKAAPGELDMSKPIMLNPMQTPMFKDDFTRISENEMMSIMMSGAYLPEPYIDSNKNIVLFVMRKASQEEQAFMQAQQGDMLQSQSLEGQKAKDFKFKDISGTAYSLKALKGKVIVLNFWFVECKPCVMEIPELNELVEKYKQQDVVFLGLATNNEKKVLEFIASHAFNYALVANTQAYANAYHISGFPTHMVIDQNGKIAFSATGYVPTTIDQLDAVIGKLLKENDR